MNAPRFSRKIAVRMAASATTSRSNWQRNRVFLFFASLKLAVILLAFSLAPHVRPRRRWVLWVAAAIVIFLACCARVWAGVHWPSDVAGGFLLGLGWAAFVVWLPERWLPSPTWKWFRARRHRAPT